MKSKVAVLALTIACFGYLAIGTSRALQLSGEKSLSTTILSLSVLAIVVISALLIMREIIFGIHISQMSTVLEAEELLLPDDLPHTSSGQTEKSAADARFHNISLEVEQNPDSWRAWFRVAMAYDESRDRKRARAAMRQAEKLFKANR